MKKKNIKSLLMTMLLLGGAHAMADSADIDANVEAARTEALILCESPEVVSDPETYENCIQTVNEAFTKTSRQKILTAEGQEIWKTFKEKTAQGWNGSVEYVKDNTETSLAIGVTAMVLPFLVAFTIDLAYAFLVRVLPYILTGITGAGLIITVVSLGIITIEYFDVADSSELKTQAKSFLTKAKSTLTVADSSELKTEAKSFLTKAASTLTMEPDHATFEHRPDMIWP